MRETSTRAFDFVLTAINPLIHLHLPEISKIPFLIYRISSTKRERPRFQTFKGLKNIQVNWTKILILKWKNRVLTLPLEIKIPMKKKKSCYKKEGMIANNIPQTLLRGQSLSWQMQHWKISLWNLKPLQFKTDQKWMGLQAYLKQMIIRQRTQTRKTF